MTHEYHRLINEAQMARKRIATYCKWIAYRETKDKSIILLEVYKSNHIAYHNDCLRRARIERINK
jgi:hypothetical protein